MILYRQYSYLLFCFISSYLFLFTIADNNTNTTDHHSNETIVEYNSTSFSLTTIANISNEDVSVEKVHTNILSFETTNNSTVFSTAMPVEITDVSSSQSNSSLNEDNHFTTIVTEVSTEKVDQQTTMVLNASCELTKYGCCSDGITERIGKYFY